MPATGNGCPDAPAPIYVLAEGPTPDAPDVLMAFDPPTGAFTQLITVACIGTDQLTTGLAVDRAGYAYIVGRSDLNRQMFRVSVADGSCELTPFVSWTGAMAFAGQGAGETLFLVELPGEMVSVDTRTFAVRDIGQGPPGLLTGTRTGDLFSTSFGATAPKCLDADAGASSDGGGRRGGKGCMVDPTAPPPVPLVTIERVDTATSAQTPLWTASAPVSFAEGGTLGVAVWGGDFYFFVTPLRGSLGPGPPAPGFSTGVGVPGAVVWRFRPSDLSVVPVAQTDMTLLGVTASTCAPL